MRLGTSLAEYDRKRSPVRSSDGRRRWPARCGPQGRGKGQCRQRRARIDIRMCKASMRSRYSARSQQARSTAPREQALSPRRCSNRSAEIPPVVRRRRSRDLMSYKNVLVRHKGAVYKACNSGAAIRCRIVEGSNDRPERQRAVAGRHPRGRHRREPGVALPVPGESKAHARRREQIAVHFVAIRNCLRGRSR